MNVPAPDSAPDKRRAVRVPTRLYVRVLGRNERPSLREGNISASGIYFNTDAEQTEVGDVERLEIKNADGSLRVVTAAAVVRTHQVHDLWSEHRNIGVAYQFMPGDEATRDDIITMVKHEAETMLHHSGGTLVTAGAPATTEVRGHGHADLVNVGSNQLALMADWPVEIGARISVSIREGEGAPILLDGVVDEREAIIPGERFRIHVALGNDSSGARGDRAARKAAIGEVLDRVVTPASTVGEMRSSAALSGRIDRVPLPGVLSFIEYERLSGTLSLVHGDDRAKIYVRTGRPVDVECSWAARSPRLALDAVLKWSQGTFRLAVKKQARADTVGAHFSQIILQHATQDDEAHH